MRIVGVLERTETSPSVWILKCGKKRIPIVGALGSVAGQRVALDGCLSWSRTYGSYFKAFAWEITDDADCNKVCISGVITGVLPEILNSRGVRSACVFIRQTESHGSTVLITALSSSIDVLTPDTLVVGDRLSISGYISSHRKGLHVLYAGTD